VTIKYNLGRNKYEEYKVTIKELYENVFLVELKNNSKRSFTYTDVITKTIKIDY
ncbi:MAG TPA: Veg family protein, partial [Candidatus Faecisoma merdavium]|nr:Veg family protein [Candidatus Faecisoma merdavium]